MNRRLSSILPALWLGLAGVVFGPATAEAPVPVGAEGFVRTAVEGGEIASIPVRFLGVYEGAVGPGYDVYLVELTGPLAERVGVAAGMSGSPVYCGEELVGALAYRYGSLPKRAIGGVTPMKNVLAVSAPEASPHRDLADRPSSGGPQPIATPVSLGGLVPPVREWLAPRLRESGLLAVPGGGGSTSTAEPRGLAPGSPVAVRLVGGDATIAATGTVTWVDGDTVYAFGHPFLGTGRTELPMTEATVLHTLADLAGSVKLVNPGPEVGAVFDDRLTAVAGRLGARASTIRVGITVSGGAYGERSYRYDVARHSVLTPHMIGAVAANALLTTTGYDHAMTMAGEGRIRFADLPDLPLRVAFSGDGSANPAQSVASRLSTVFGMLYRNPHRRPEIEALDLDLTVSLDRREYTVDSVLYDRGELSPGDRLRVVCVLRGYRGETVRRVVELRVPREALHRSRLTLLVGNDDYVRNAVGEGLSQRLATARDLPALVRALAQLGATDRLVVALYRPASGVVAAGAMREGLPGSAARLLAGPGRDAGRGGQALVAREVLELDGPVSGGTQVRLRVRERAPAGERR